MNSLPQISKTASRQKLPLCGFASRENRLERRTSARVWRRRSLKLASAPCQDQETNTHYNYFRDYEPSTGRYVQSDPIGLAGGLNTFSYVTASPLLWVDAFGLDRHIYFLDNAEGRSGNRLYPATVYVWDDVSGEIFGPFRGSTEADQTREKCKEGCPQVAAGKMKYSTGSFPNNPRRGQRRKPALEIGTAPATAPNPNNPMKLPQINGVWIHWGYKTTTGSEGCLTIHPDDWATFLSKFPKGTTGTVEVVR